MYSLTTRRLTLRPFNLSDAPLVQKYAGAREVAYNTLMIPHPYPDGVAENFITSVNWDMERGDCFVFAITSTADKAMVGCIGLTMYREHAKAELGYWLGVPYWNRGYTSEAARKMIEFGFETVQLNRIFAACFARNPASARVMEKAGMKFEGTLRQHYERWGEYLDTHYYGILRGEYHSAKTSNTGD